MSPPALAIQQAGLSVVTADNLNTFEQTCDNFSELRAFTGISGMQVYVRGKAAPSDGYQGVFYWNAGFVGSDNNETIIVPSGASTGAWIKIGLWGSFTPSVTLTGGSGTSVTNASGFYRLQDQTLSINAAFTVNYSVVPTAVQMALPASLAAGALQTIVGNNGTDLIFGAIGSSGSTITFLLYNGSSPVPSSGMTINITGVLQVL